MEKQAWTAVGNLTLRLPEPIAVQSDLQLSGHLDDGRNLLNMQYEISVGELPSD